MVGDGAMVDGDEPLLKAGFVSRSTPEAAKNMNKRLQAGRCSKIGQQIRMTGTKGGIAFSCAS